MLLYPAETELVTSKEDAGHRRFVTERRARRERPPYPEDSLTADNPTAALLLPSAALRHNSSIHGNVPQSLAELTAGATVPAA